MSSSAIKAQPFDVAIAGGGMVGATLARALAGLGVRIALIERVAPDAVEQPSFDERTTALSNASRRVFDALNVWSEVRASATPIHQIHVSESGRFGFARINAREQGLEALGYVVPNRELGRALWQGVAQSPNVTVFCPAEVRALQSSETLVTLELAGGAPSTSALPGSVQAKLVIAADGAQSKVAAAAGIGSSASDYQQSALVTTVLPQQYHANVAYERFTPAGPLALLPLADGRCATVLTLRAHDAVRAAQWSDADFLRELQSRFGFRLGRFLQAGRRNIYPLALRRSEATSASRCIVMGNAAQTLHPVAGMGFNLGVRDAACLAELIAGDVKNGEADSGRSALLAQYDAWRARDRRSIIRFTDALVRLFDNPLASVGLARRAGLLMFDLVPPAKSALSRLSTGAALAPRLARGVPLS